MRVLLLVSAFNGLSQRAWCALREAGHDVGVLLGTGPRAVVDEKMDAGPIWATRTFARPAVAPRKSPFYNGPVADAAMAPRVRSAVPLSA